MTSSGNFISLNVFSLLIWPIFAVLSSFFKGINLAVVALFFKRYCLTKRSLLASSSESTHLSSARVSSTLDQSRSSLDNSIKRGIGVLPPETARLAHPSFCIELSRILAISLDYCVTKDSRLVVLIKPI